VDGIDAIIEQWGRERPDLDLSAMRVFGRLSQVTALLTNAVEPVFEKHGLRRGEFDVLAALRRSGEPYTLIPSELADALMMSRAGMTNRLDRLEEAGLVERRLDPNNRRSLLVALTEQGRKVIDETMTDHAANLKRLMPQDVGDLEERLRNLLRDLS
jgi:DNA-binding MarR family transcriptional regulator